MIAGELLPYSWASDQNLDLNFWMHCQALDYQRPEWFRTVQTAIGILRKSAAIWGFHKLGYPQIINFSRIFPYKPSSYWGYPIDGNPTSLLQSGYEMLLIRPPEHNGLSLIWYVLCLAGLKRRTQNARSGTRVPNAGGLIVVFNPSEPCRSFLPPGKRIRYSQGCFQQFPGGFIHHLSL